MQLDLFATLSFILLSSITPGPNNISCFSMCANYGLRKTLPYMFGVWIGAFCLLLFTGFFSSILFQTVPLLKEVLKYVGASYIVFLAYKTFIAAYDIDGKKEKVLSFSKGIILQAVNPKGLVFCTTIFSTFLADVSHHQVMILPISFGISCVTFLCVSIWAIGGGFIQRFMHISWVRYTVNGAMASALIYLAVKIAFFM